MNLKRVLRQIIDRLHATSASPLASGQAILLIAIASIGLIAMMGLAIDGGRLLFLRRETQNASDAGAIAAARALCTGQDPVAQGRAATTANGFDNNGTDNWVDIIYPASTVPTGVDPECAPCFIEVKVRGSVPASFIGIVYNGPLEATSRSIGTCNPDLQGGGAPPELRALWAMGESCPNASVSVTGSDVLIEGGVHSNGDLQVNAGIGGGHVGLVIGPSSYVDVVQNENKVTWQVGDYPSSDLTTDAGTCSSDCFTTITGSDSPYPDSALYQTTVQEEWPIEYHIEDYRPDGTLAQSAKDRGEYYEVPCSNGKNFMDWAEDEGLLDPVTKTLKDGIYYSPCDLQFGQGGGSTAGWDDLKGNVTFVSEEEMHLTGARLDLRPYDADGDGSTSDDLLIFCNDYSTNPSGGIHFSGTENHWVGNVYAPNSSFQTSGSSNNALESCVMAQCIDFSGSNNGINCQPSVADPGPPGIWLAQ